MGEQSAAASTEQQIEILLTEYTALRDELVQQQSSAHSLYGAAATVAGGVFLIESKFSPLVGVLLLVAAPLFAWVTYRNLEYSMRKFGARLLELEIQINGLAGAHLLKWEQVYGGTLPSQRLLRAEMIFGHRICSMYLRFRRSRRAALPGN